MVITMKKAKKLLLTILITLIIPVRILGEGIIVFNYVYAEENNNNVYIENTPEEPTEVID